MPVKKSEPNADAEERYQAFIQNSSEAIWRFELDAPIDTSLPADEQIKLMYERAYLAEANMAMAEMYGYDTVDAIIGLRLSAVHVKHDPANIAYLTAFIESGYRLTGVESHEIDRAGNSKYFRNSLIGIVENGLLVRAWGTQQDITDQHEAHEALQKSEELRAANVQLKGQRAQLMALNRSKDEFISLASHQLRTPATGVKQYLGMLIEGYAGPLNEQQMQLLKTAYESNERQLTIIDDLLRVAHVDAGKVRLSKQKVDLVRLLKDVISEQQDSFKARNQRVYLEHAKARVFADIDKDRMRMVFENLVDNASKYSPAGNEITIHIETTLREVMVHIRDQGVGIAQKDLGNLFQKFSRVRNPLSAFVGGTGIGLYWAKKIVDLHKGTIDVESRLHKGTTFTVRFPKNPTKEKRAPKN